MFYLAKTWKDRLEQMQALKDKCNSIVDKLALPRDDIRTVGLIHVRQFCNTLAAIPMKLQQNAEISKLRPAVMSILGISNVNDLKLCLCDFNKNSKTSFVTMAQFALENCVARVLKAIDKKPANSFTVNIDQLTKATELADIDKKRNILKVPARIRNSLHAGGIHGGDRGPAEVDIDGVQYRFVKGHRVVGASWSHIFHVYSHCLDIYEEMFCSLRVRAKELIPAE